MNGSWNVVTKGRVNSSIIKVDPRPQDLLNSDSAEFDIKSGLPEVAEIIAQ